MAKNRELARSGAPWSAGCGTCGAKWCFVRCLQFGRNLEELAHGVRPGHADILVLEHEEVAIPRPGLCLPRSAQVQLDQCLLIGQMVATNRNAPGDQAGAFQEKCLSECYLMKLL